jgi:hypothetical protein
MGGLGSGWSGGRPTVESALRLDIDDMMQWRGIRAFARLAGEMRFNFYGDDIDVKFESHAGDPWNSWLRLRYSMTEYWTGEEIEIDDQIYLAASRPHFGGLRWWFVCPRLNRRVRKLYLPLGGRHFWSRRAYRLAYESQRGTAIDRAHRGQAKIKMIGDLDPGEWDLPPKPKWMRWDKYNRYVDRYDAYEAILDQGTFALMAKLMGRSR